MTVIGYSTLEVTPELKNVGRELDRQAGSQLDAVGRRSGQKFGDAAGREAGGRFKKGLSGSLRGYVAPFAGILAGAGIADFFRDSFAEAKEAGQVSRVTAKLIETTGHAANLTATEVGKLSERMMEYAAVDDELVQSGANVMLTFRNVRNEVGAGNQIFDRSIKAGLDLAAVLKTDLSASALQLGKALNDPVKGMTALGRAGVQFTAQQKEQIKGFVDSGNLLKAQKAILTEVEKQVGGAAGAAADGTDRLAVAMGNLKESFGQEIMPAVEAFSGWAVDDGIPALSGLGGAAKDTVTAVAGLPGPLLAGAAAFGVMKIAAATSLGTTAAAGIASVGSGLVGLRIRTMLANDAFVAARSASITLTGSLAGVSLGAGRATAAMAGLRAASVGAGAAMTSGLSRASAIVGGPWGAAFIAGTAILTKFYAQNQKVKAQIESMKGTFEQQTGEFTAETAKQALQVIGDEWLKYAKDIGISMEDLTAAAVEGGPALDAFKAKYGDILRKDDSIESFTSQIEDANKVVKLSQIAFEATKEGVDGYVSQLDKAKAAAEASASATKGNITSLTGYRTEIGKVRAELQKLIDKEQKRALAAIQSQRDELALVTTMQATRKEAREGARTLDINTKAGQENKAALLDLADQWANSTPKARAAVGGYEEMRRKFIEVATAMGDGPGARGQAIKLADALLKVPKTAPLKFQSEGFKQRMAEIEALKREAAKLREAFRIVYSSQASNQQSALDDRRFASGGRVGGRGIGDNQLIWADPREWVINPKATAYYGDSLMNAINKMQIPRFAGGGPIVQQAAAPRAAGGGGVHIASLNVYADTYDEIMRKASVKVGMAMNDGMDAP